MPKRTSCTRHQRYFHMCVDCRAADMAGTQDVETQQRTLMRCIKHTKFLAGCPACQKASREYYRAKRAEKGKTLQPFKWVENKSQPEPVELVVVEIKPTKKRISSCDEHREYTVGCLPCRERNREYNAMRRRAAGIPEAPHLKDGAVKYRADNVEYKKCRPDTGCLVCYPVEEKKGVKYTLDGKPIRRKAQHEPTTMEIIEQKKQEYLATHGPTDIKFSG